MRIQIQEAAGAGQKDKPHFKHIIGDKGEKITLLFYPPYIHPKQTAPSKKQKTPELFVLFFQRRLPNYRRETG